MYLWNATSGDIQQLMEMESSEEYVSSVSWVKEGNYLAIGTSAATVQVSVVKNAIFGWMVNYCGIFSDERVNPSQISMANDLT